MALRAPLLLDEKLCLLNAVELVVAAAGVVSILQPDAQRTGRGRRSPAAVRSCFFTGQSA